MLGIAPPPVEPSPNALQRSPVFVRSGTSVADVEPPPVPRMALPSRPPSSPGVTEQPAASSSLAPAGAQFERTRSVLSAHPALWMLLAPSLLAVTAIALLRATAVHHGAKLLQTAASASARPSAPQVPTESAAQQVARLKARPPESLTARELALLADAQTDEARAAAKALRAKLEENPALGRDPTVQRELLRLADDARTSTDALSAMALLDAPTGADLLYEVWTHTPVRTDATDLARALVYSTDVRPKASPALAVALELRSADRCEQYKAILPKALKDGDRRSAHLLLKLSGKRGCGPKKRDDCYPCLREQPDELAATISAAKSRRSPDFGAP